MWNIFLLSVATLTRWELIQVEVSKMSSSSPLTDIKQSIIFGSLTCQSSLPPSLLHLFLLVLLQNTPLTKSSPALGFTNKEQTCGKLRRANAREVAPEFEIGWIFLWWCNEQSELMYKRVLRVWVLDTYGSDTPRPCSDLTLYLCLHLLWLIRLQVISCRQVTICDFTEQHLLSAQLHWTWHQSWVY